MKSLEDRIDDFQRDIVEFVERARAVASPLAERALIPPPCRQQFIDEMQQILFQARLSQKKDSERDRQMERTILEVEAGLRRALVALRSGPPETRLFLSDVM